MHAEEREQMCQAGMEEPTIAPSAMGVDDRLTYLTPPLNWTVNWEGHLEDGTMIADTLTEQNIYDGIRLLQRGGRNKTMNDGPIGYGEGRIATQAQPPRQGAGTAHIERVLNGFVVTVGCQRVVFKNAQELAEELQRYYKNPAEVEAEYMKKGGN